MYTKKEKEVINDNIERVITSFDKSHKQLTCSLRRGYYNLQHILIKSIRTRKREGYVILVPTRYELLPCPSDRYHYELYYPCPVPYRTKTQVYSTDSLSLINEFYHDN